jgi:hypothetical protein
VTLARIKQIGPQIRAFRWTGPGRNPNDFSEDTMADNVHVHNDGGAAGLVWVIVGVILLVVIAWFLFAGGGGVDAGGAGAGANENGVNVEVNAPTIEAPAGGTGNGGN